MARHTAEDAVSDLAWHPEANSLAYVTEDGKVAVWAQAVPQQLAEPFGTADAAMRLMSRSPGSKEVAGDNLGAVVCCEVGYWSGAWRIKALNQMSRWTTEVHFCEKMHCYATWLVLQLSLLLANHIRFYPLQVRTSHAARQACVLQGWWCKRSGQWHKDKTLHRFHTLGCSA